MSRLPGLCAIAAGLSAAVVGACPGSAGEPALAVECFDWPEAPDARDPLALRLDDAQRREAAELRTQMTGALLRIAQSLESRERLVAWLQAIRVEFRQKRLGTLTAERRAELEKRQAPPHVERLFVLDLGQNGSERRHGAARCGTDPRGPRARGRLRRRQPHRPLPSPALCAIAKRQVIGVPLLRERGADCQSAVVLAGWQPAPRTMDASFAAG